MNHFIVRPTGPNPIKTGTGRSMVSVPTSPPPPPPSGDRTTRSNMPSGLTLIDDTTFRDNGSTAILNNGTNYSSWSVAWNNPNGEGVNLYRNAEEDALESRFNSNWQAGGGALIERSSNFGRVYLSFACKMASNWNPAWNGFSRFKIFYFNSLIMEFQRGWGNPEGIYAPALALGSDYGVNVVTNQNLPNNDWFEVESLIDRRGSNGSHIWQIWVNNVLWLSYNNLTLTTLSPFKYTPQASGSGSGSGVGTSIFISDSYMAGSN